MVFGFFHKSSLDSKTTVAGWSDGRHGFVCVHGQLLAL